MKKTKKTVHTPPDNVGVFPAAIPPLPKPTKRASPSKRQKISSLCHPPTKKNFTDTSVIQENLCQWCLVKAPNFGTIFGGHRTPCGNFHWWQEDEKRRQVKFTFSVTLGPEVRQRGFVYSDRNRKGIVPESMTFNNQCIAKTKKKIIEK